MTNHLCDLKRAGFSDNGVGTIRRENKRQVEEARMYLLGDEQKSGVYGGRRQATWFWTTHSPPVERWFPLDFSLIALALAIRVTQYTTMSL